MYPKHHQASSGVWAARSPKPVPRPAKGHFWDGLPYFNRLNTSVACRDKFIALPHRGIKRRERATRKICSVGPMALHRVGSRDVNFHVSTVDLIASNSKTWHRRELTSLDGPCAARVN